MQISFLGAAHEVTGSCTLLSVADHKILIDCGLEQGPDTYENCEIPINIEDIDCIFLTHAHIDHSGKIPYLVANGYHGPIYATGLSKKLCDIMLEDSAHIQEMEAMWRNRKAKRSGKKPYELLYSVEDAKEAIKLFVSCEYERTYDIFSDVQIKFIDSGHLLGSAAIQVTATENGTTKTILFSGDVGNVNRPLIKDPTKPKKANFVVIESTYGDRLHDRNKDNIDQLANIIQQTLDKGGNVVIPSFAVGRTQELLYLIRTIKEQNMVRNHPDFPVWLDSPLAIEATEIYSKEVAKYCDDETMSLINKGINVLKFPGLNIAITAQDSQKINLDATPKVIISASGMCEAGRIRHHLKHNLWRENSSILFVGYQAQGTLGRMLIEGTKTVKLFGEKIQVNAEIHTMHGVSAHADKNMLLDWIGNIDPIPEMVFVNHGDDFVCDKFAQAISERFNIKATAPYNGAIYDLTNGECLNVGNTVRIIKTLTFENKPSKVFNKLLNAQNRLMAIVEQNKDGANKDITKFAEQLDELCNKWER